MYKMINQILLGLRSPQITHNDLITGGAIIDREGSAMDEYDIQRDEEDDRGRVPEATLNPDPVYEEQTYDDVDEDDLLQQALNITQPSTSHRVGELPSNNFMRRSAGNYAYSGEMGGVALYDEFRNQIIQRGTVGLPFIYPSIVNSAISASQNDVKKKLRNERIARYLRTDKDVDFEPIDIQSRIEDLERRENSSMFSEDDRRELTYLRAIERDPDIGLKAPKQKPLTVKQREKIVVDVLKEDLKDPTSAISITKHKALTALKLQEPTLKISDERMEKLEQQAEKDAISEHLALGLYANEIATRRYRIRGNVNISREPGFLETTFAINPFKPEDFVKPTEDDIELRKELLGLKPGEIDRYPESYWKNSEFDLKYMSIDNYLDDSQTRGGDELTRRILTTAGLINPYARMTDYEILQIYKRLNSLTPDEKENIMYELEGNSGIVAPPLHDNNPRELSNREVLYIANVLGTIEEDQPDDIAFGKKYTPKQQEAIFNKRFDLLGYDPKLHDGKAKTKKNAKISDDHLRYIEMRAKSLMGIPAYRRKSRYDIPRYDELDDEELEIQEQYESIRDFLPDDVDLEAMDLEEIDDPLDVEGLVSYADEMNEVRESAKRDAINMMDEAINNLREAIRLMNEVYYTDANASVVNELRTEADNILEEAYDLLNDYDWRDDDDIKRMDILIKAVYDKYDNTQFEVLEEETKEENPEKLIESKEDEPVSRKRPMEVIDLVSTDEEEEEEEEPAPKKAKRGRKVLSFNDTIMENAMKSGITNLNEFYDDVWENETVLKKQGKRKEQLKLEDLDSIDDKGTKNNIYSNRLRTLNNPKISNFKEVSGNKTKQQIIDEYINDMIEKGFLDEEDRNKKLDSKGVYIAHLYQYLGKEDTPPPPPSAPAPKRKVGRPPKKKDDDKEGSGMKSKLKVIKL